MSQYQLTANSEGRLDKIVFEEVSRLPDFAGVTRSQVKRWIELGNVTVNSITATKAGFSVSAGDQIQVSVVPEVRGEIVPYAHELSILYEDDELVVLDKPAGLTMHPGAGNKERTLVNALAAHFGREVLKPLTLASGAEQRPGIVHRLDKDTSGVVVVAKTTRAQSGLSAQFAERSALRRYQALVFLTPRSKRIINTEDSGIIDAPLGRHPTKRTHIAIVPNGRRSVTHWRVTERFLYGCLLDLKLETGRTHQIRVHLAHVGSPVVGDRTYGDFSGLPQPLRLAADQLGRQALHAYFLGFTHPVTAEPLRFESPLPADIAAVVERFRSWKQP